jgi:hypothetical protein
LVHAVSVLVAATVRLVDVAHQWSGRLKWRGIVHVREVRSGLAVLAWCG